MSEETRALDGNVAGGLLQQIFVVEMTTARIVCAACGSTAIMGETAVYATAMGMVVRCPSCEHVMIRMANIPDRAWVDFQGVRLIQLSATA
ncbi:MAG: DUF6510 family protein [Anaerolineae bacterium]